MSDVRLKIAQDDEPLAQTEKPRLSCSSGLFQDSTGLMSLASIIGCFNATPRLRTLGMNGLGSCFVLLHPSEDEQSGTATMRLP